MRGVDENLVDKSFLAESSLQDTHGTRVRKSCFRRFVRQQDSRFILGLPSFQAKGDDRGVSLLHYSITRENVRYYIVIVCRSKEIGIAPFFDETREEAYGIHPSMQAYLLQRL